MARFGGPSTVFVSKTAAFTYDPTAGDARVDVILVDASAGAVTITLPDATTIPAQPFFNIGSNGVDAPGRVYIAKSDATANPVTIASTSTITGMTILRDQHCGADCMAIGGQWWTNLGSTRQRIFRASVDLSAAQIIAMNATPVTIIPAPGAGSVVVVDNITFKMTRTSTAFTSGGNVVFEYGTSGTDVTAVIASTVVTGAAGVVYQNVRGVEASTAVDANQLIQVTNLTGAFASGTGTATIFIDFHIVS